MIPIMKLNWDDFSNFFGHRICDKYQYVRNGNLFQEFVCNFAFCLAEMMGAQKVL